MPVLIVRILSSVRNISAYRALGNAAPGHYAPWNRVEKVSEGIIKASDGRLTKTHAVKK
jgi:hypothetical protein